MDVGGGGGGGGAIADPAHKVPDHDFVLPPLAPPSHPPPLTASRMKGELSHGGPLTSPSHTRGRTGCSTSSSTAGSLCILS